MKSLNKNEKATLLVSKRYRNRRLGEYLKELDLTEGHSTSIQNVLENNDSQQATVVTDEERTFFRITIPYHESAGNIIADIAHKDGSLKASKRSVLKMHNKSSMKLGIILILPFQIYQKSLEYLAVG